MQMAASLRNLPLHALLLCLAASSLLALDPTIPPSQYALRIWKEENGLPSNSLYSVTIARSGHLWAGTSDGLVRFDGSRFITYSPSSHPDMQGSFVGQVVEAADGSIWFNTTKAFHHFKNGKFTIYGEPQGLPSPLVVRHAADREGALWASTARGLVRIRDGKVQRFTIKDGLAADRTGAIFVDSTGAVWIGAAGLTRYQNGRFTAFPARFNHPVVGAIARGPSGSVWVGTYDGLYRFDGQQFHLDPRVPKGIVSALHVDRDGVLWATVSERGLLRLVGDQPPQIVPVPGVGGGDFRAIIEDREGSLWLATAHGLVLLRRGPILTYSLSEGLSGKPSEVVLEDSHHRIWAGANDSLIALSGPGYTTVQKVTGLPVSTVSALHEDSSGRLWVGLRGGIGWVENFRFRPLRDRDGPVTDQVLSLATAPDGALWAGTTRGVFRYHNGERTYFGTKQGLMNNLAGTLQFDRNGHLWAGTNDGLFVWDGNRFSPRHLPTGSIRAVRLDPDGTVWIGTAGGGLYWARHGTLHRATAASGLSGDYVAGLLEDLQGYFWISSPGSLSRVAKSELIALGDKKISRLSVLRFGLTDGMRERGPNSGWQPDSWRAHDGKLWFPTDSGLIQVDPTRVQLAPPPVALIESATLDGQPLNLAQPLLLKAGAGRLEFRFSAPALLWADQLRFRYRLTGVDKDWVEARDSRSATYTLLPAGAHSLEVQTSDPAGNWSGVPLRLTFEQAPFFYRTWWFATLCLVALSLLLWLLYRLRIRQMEARHAVVLSERTRIARELHDSLLQEVLGASLQLQGASLIMDSRPAEARQKVDRIGEQLHEAFREARNYIGHLRLCAEDKDLADSLGQLGHNMTAPHGIAWTMDQTPLPATLDTATRFELLQMAREIIHNAIQHSGASRIEATLHADKGHLCLCIVDNGKGFTPGQLPNDGRKHWGLVGLGERSSGLGGSLDIESTPGQGTRINCRVPLASPSRWRQFLPAFPWWNRLSRSPQL